jgi:HK97 gp10 family phage protein
MSKPLVEITGFPELQAQIKRLATDREKVSETRKVLRKVAQATVKAARSEAPVAKRVHIARKTKIEPGTLRKSIGVITGKNKENPTVFVGPRAKGTNKGWYGHFVHNNTNVYRSGFKRKRSAAAKSFNAAGAVAVRKGNPFMTRAYNLTKGGVTAGAEKQVAAYIQKRINALSTK